jgi:DNA polymerase-3 subunit alpha
LTIGTEKSKSAILSAARGLEIDNDTAQYICSLIPSDRGITRTLSQCYYGDKENNYAPISNFKKVMDSNPELWKVAQKIEGLVCRIGIHAGGLILVDEDFTESGALMTAPDGTIITQFDLHDSEKVSNIKYDALSVEAVDKIQVCLELLVKYGYIKQYPTLRETYENAIGIYNLERDDIKMWQMVWEHKIQSLFQMEKMSGIQGIELTHPSSVDDLATLNSVIRLMAQEKGGEQPLNKYARFKKDINLWYKEMSDYGLTSQEQEILKGVLGISSGMCESQERFMQLVQIPECGGFNLNFADKLRKSIAKKNPEEFKNLEKEYFKVVEEKGLSKKLCEYVWYVCIYTSRGYG